MKKVKIWWTEKNEATFELEDEEEPDFYKLHKEAVESGNYDYAGLEDGDIY